MRKCTPKLLQLLLLGKSQYFIVQVAILIYKRHNSPQGKYVNIGMDNYLSLLYCLKQWLQTFDKDRLKLKSEIYGIIFHNY